jgi:hypothetical protein
MLKKTITFFDYNEKPCTEDFFFNLTTAELAEMELSTPGGMEVMLKKIIASNDGAAIIEVFQNLLSKSYGKKSEDGRRFSKKPEYWEEFLEIGAYDVLFVQLVTDANAASEFVNGLLPTNLVERASEVQATRSETETALSQKSGAATLQPSPVFRPELIKDAPFIQNVELPKTSEKKVLADYTDKELQEMDRDDLLRLMRVSQAVALGELITRPQE